MLYATSGSRKTEAWKLKETDIDFSLRRVKPKHDTRTKKAGVSFYNAECSAFIEKLKIKNGKLFRIGKRRFVAMWNRASEKADFRITPQVLRVWHSTELGEHGIPERYVDVFKGRARATGKELLRLKRIDDGANLTINT